MLFHTLMINSNTIQKILMSSKMPIYAEKYATCALAENMRQSITYLYETDNDMAREYQ